MIPVKVALVIIFIVLVFLLILRKTKGLKGTWDKKEDIQEYAFLMGDVKEHKNNKKNITVKQQITSSKNTSGGMKTEGESIGEKICRSHLNSRFNVDFIKKRPEFLKNPITNTNLELDCFCEDLKLALEYNGKQHYEFVPKFHKTKNDFYNQKYRDEIKKRLCSENGIDLIEVPYTVSHSDIPYYIDAALEKLGRLRFV